MPRNARKISRTDTYHVIMRAVNKQQIFYDREDFLTFRRLLAHYKPICGYQLFAYCIMSNHVHLLLRTGTEPLDRVIKHIGTAFVYWYNTKYKRVGHLFQDRYRSEAVETEAYFMIVLRYILRNPIKAGLCKLPEDYPYSSGREYILREMGVTDTDYVFGTLGGHSLGGFISQNNDDECLEVKETVKIRYTDTDAMHLIVQEFGTLSPKIGKPKERASLNRSIHKLIKAGISIRQLSRITGISKSIIEKGLK